MATVTIRTEAPTAGPTAFIAALVCWGLGIVIAAFAVAWVGYPAAVDTHSADFNPVPFIIALCFALLGSYFLIRGVLHTLRYRKFGSSVLEISEARVGKSLHGVIRTTSDLAPLGDFQLRPRCDLLTSVRVLTGWRGGVSCMWEAAQAGPAATRSGVGIPVNFAIPDTAVASGTRKSTSNASERVNWTLEVSAPLGGVNYYAQFPINVKARERGDDHLGAGAPLSSVRAESGPFAGEKKPASAALMFVFAVLAFFGAMLVIAGASSVRAGHWIGSLGGIAVGLFLLCLAWAIWRKRSTSRRS